MNPFDLRDSPFPMRTARGQPAATGRRIAILFHATRV
jgi:hypothetical protein